MGIVGTRGSRIRTHPHRSSGDVQHITIVQILPSTWSPGASAVTEEMVVVMVQVTHRFIVRASVAVAAVCGASWLSLPTAAAGAGGVDPGENPGGIVAPGGDPVLPLTSCNFQSDTATQNGSGELTNTSPSCGAGYERVGGGCNVDGGHVDHARLTSSYPGSGTTWTCQAYHQSSDSGFDLAAFTICCQ